MLRLPLAFLAAVSLLVACDSSTPDAEPSTSAPQTAVAGLDVGDDVTEAIVQLGAGTSWDGVVVEAVMPEPGRLEIATSLVDPRGDSGSAPALVAVEICQAGTGWLAGQGVEAPYVSVLEEDGTVFALGGHPAYPECAEV